MAEQLYAERLCPTCNQTWQLMVTRVERVATTRRSTCYECRGRKSAVTAAARALATLSRTVASQPRGMRLGLCREVDPKLWFPEKGQPQQAIQAKRICEECPVRAACLQWAIDTRQMHGIWGGKTIRERLRMLGEERATA